MSGIVGIINLDGAPVDPRLLERMTGFLSQRGPDEKQTWLNGNVGFGHTLLRTTLESLHEKQPFNLDGQVWITADARVDDRIGLIQKLEHQTGDDLRAVPDVELVLHAYRMWGEDCVKHLIGDFAFAIWDAPRQRLFCARDHFGVKPFFYAMTGKSFVFSNTLNCVRLHPGVSAELNDQAIGDFLLFDYNQDPATTSFADIRRLPAAHTLSLHLNRLSVRRYWSLPKGGRIRYQKPGEYVEHFRDILATAVKDRLRTESAGVFMSGGLDSPIVAAVACQQLDRNADLQAYTVVYDKLIPDQERYYSGLAAKKIGITVNYLAADDYQPYERWDQAEVRGPEPSANVYSAISADQYRQITPQARVVFTGYGGDPVFRYCFTPHTRALLRSRRPLRALVDVWKYASLDRGVRMMILPRVQRFMQGRNNSASNYPAWLDRDFERSLNLKERWKEINNSPSANHPRAQGYELMTAPFWPFLFESYDSGLTSFPLEVRHPFFDLRLIDYVWSIPGVPWSLDKTIVRRAAAGVLPEPVRRRPKAPLAGNVLLAYLQRHPNEDIYAVEPASRLSRYVDERVFSQLAPQNGSDLFWENLRPVSLDHWLRYLNH